MARILLCKRGKFGEKNYYNSEDIEFFLGDYFLLVRPVDIGLQQNSQMKPHSNHILDVDCVVADLKWKWVDALKIKYSIDFKR